jgi:Helix-turn-helix domain
MPRRRSSAQVVRPDSPPAAHPAPLVIEPNGVYQPDYVRATLQLTATTLRREIRLGRLKVCKRGGRYFFLGEQLLAWLRGGEVCRAGPSSPQPSVIVNGKGAHST